MKQAEYPLSEDECLAGFLPKKNKNPNPKKVPNSHCEKTHVSILDKITTSYPREEHELTRTRFFFFTILTQTLLPLLAKRAMSLFKSKFT